MGLDERCKLESELIWLSQNGILPIKLSLENA